MTEEPSTPSPSDADVLALIEQPQFLLDPVDKERRLCAIFDAQVARQTERLPAFARLVLRLGFDGELPFSRYEDIPYLHVSAFKAHELRSVPEDKVVRVVTSSATTSGTPSRIHIDKPTSFRQSKALASTLTNVLGKSRRPYLVLDAAESNAATSSISARGAAIRGLLPFASEVTYALDLHGTSLAPNDERIAQFFEKNASKAPLLFGFTYIVWSVVLAELDKRGRRFGPAPDAMLLHSGGWKKLTEIAVGKDVFAAKAGEIFGLPSAHVLDFYGMAEQVGVVFVDCVAGNKHPPDFADVLLRNPLTLDRVGPGEAGLIEVLSVLPESYPGQALLTDDVGILVGEDGCACGRRGRHFRIRSRVAQAEVRGCGDTFAQKRVMK